MYNNDGQRQHQPCPPGTVPYTIKEGDTFYRLAIRFNTTAATLIMSNPGANPHNLQMGQSICVPRQQSYPTCPEGNYPPIPPRATLAPLPPTKQLPVSVEGTIEYRLAQLYRSDQSYNIYILDNYKFTAEEPGSDVLFSTLDDSFYVRIQRLPLEADLSKLRETMSLSLGSTGEPRELSGAVFSDTFFHTSKLILSASNEEITVYSILKEIEGVLFRFTMFFPHSEAAEGIIPGFYAMLITIDVT